MAGLTNTGQSEFDIISLMRRGEIGRLPERLRCLFDPQSLSADMLDVSNLFPFSHPSRCIIRLGSVPLPIKESMSVFARLSVFLGKAPSTVQGHINSIVSLYNELRQRGIQDLRMARLEDVLAILNTGNYSANVCLKRCSSLKYYFMLLQSFCGPQLIYMDMQGLENTRKRYSKLVSATAEGHKTPDIDPEFFSALETELLFIIRDDKIKINYRMTAAMLLLEMYVGLRPSELMTLSTASHVVKISIRNLKADYLFYGVPKLSHGGRIERYAECYMLPGAVTAFDALVELRKLVSGYEKTEALYILEPRAKAKEKSDNSNSIKDRQRSFSFYLTQLYTRNLRGLSTEKWNEIKSHIINGVTYYFPNLTQYRVRLCSYLYRQGIRLHIIELGMSHLSLDMIAYYYRVNDKTFMRYNSRLDNLIRTKINNDFDIDDHDEKGDALLRGFNLSLSKFRVYAAQLEKMLAKGEGYEYEVDRYTKLCRSMISSELRPALSYLAYLIDDCGQEAVKARFPNLGHILTYLDSIHNEITIWERQRKM